MPEAGTGARPPFLPGRCRGTARARPGCFRAKGTEKGSFVLCRKAAPCCRAEYGSPLSDAGESAEGRVFRTEAPRQTGRDGMRDLPAEAKENGRDRTPRHAARRGVAHPSGGHRSAEMFGQGRLTAAHGVRFIVLKEEEKNNLAVFVPFRKCRDGEKRWGMRLFRRRAFMPEHKAGGERGEPPVFSEKKRRRTEDVPARRLRVRPQGGRGSRGYSSFAVSKS